MQIQDGKLYLNRTWKYIYPALRVYGHQPITYLNDLIKQGVGVFDFNYQDEEKHIPKIFILIQTKVLNMRGINSREYDQRVANFFNFIREQEYYVDDYIYDINSKCCSHMVVLKFPEYYNNIFEYFKKGQYSKMYPDKTIMKKLFPNTSLGKNVLSASVNLSESLGEHLEIHKVLSKDDSYKRDFVRLVNKDFGTSLKESDFGEDIEYDYSPILKEEVFNFQIKS